MPNASMNYANELAKRGYAVLAHDAFAFGSRRVRQEEVAAAIRLSCVPSEFQARTARGLRV